MNEIKIGYCQATFKGPLCRYRGKVEKCDKTIQGCEGLGNTINFRGQPSIPSLRRRAVLRLVK